MENGLKFSGSEKGEEQDFEVPSHAERKLG